MALVLENGIAFTVEVVGVRTEEDTVNSWLD